ncbi:MAG TPA: hypothetical protein VHN80_03000 [Kineosporiaceae bacterium]|nr:hypothetical protein [Kineosporiaceae bacterium]
MGVVRLVETVHHYARVPVAATQGGEQTAPGGVRRRRVDLLLDPELLRQPVYQLGLADAAQRNGGVRAGTGPTDGDSGPAVEIVGPAGLDDLADECGLAAPGWSGDDQQASSAAARPVPQRRPAVLPADEVHADLA